MSSDTSARPEPCGSTERKTTSSPEMRIMRRMAEGCKRYGLIADGDHILVGLSGGKDSLTLLEMLGRRQRIRVPSICVEAAHIRIAGVEYASDPTYLESFASRCGTRLHIIECRMPDIPHKPPCFRCSWERRKALFRLAQEVGCNKIALGHHQDDLIMTALMNLTFQGQFATMPPLLQMRKMPLSIIRPLCLVVENDIEAWAQAQGYQALIKHCPHERETNRTAIAGVLREMERLGSDARNSVWNAIEKTFTAL